MCCTVVVDTSFLISLVSEDREAHETAKKYYKYFLDNNIQMILPTVVVAEFAIKQPPEDLPLQNFKVAPFNFETAKKCAKLNAIKYRAQQREEDKGQRDSVKDDFKIIAHAAIVPAMWLVTEDEGTMAHYCKQLNDEGVLSLKVVPLWEPFDVSYINSDGQ